MKIFRYTLRMPDELAEAVRQTAYFTGVSMNKIFYYCIRGYIKGWIKTQKAARAEKINSNWKEQILRQLDEIFSQADKEYNSPKREK